MASPFKVFRKNQKLWIAGLTILAMFGFVFLPTILQIMGGSSSSNPVAFTSKFGDLRERELHLLRERHLKTIGILVNLHEKAMGYPNPDFQRNLENLFGGPNLDDVAVSWLFSRRAQEIGLVVSNKMINDFIGQITDNRLPNDEVKKILQQSGVRELQFFDMMRDELLVGKLKQMFIPGIRAVTPGQRWDYFCRVKRQAAIEAIPLAVADYVDQVKDKPTAEELQSFFEEHKEALPYPSSPTPGFKKPHKIALAYYKAEIEKFESSIPDEDVLRRYEKDKEYYDLRFPEPSAEKPAAETKQKSPEGERKAPGKESLKEKEAESAKPAIEPPQGASGEKSRPRQKPETEQKSPEPKAEQPLPKAEQKDQKEEKSTPNAAALDSSPFILAAFQAPPVTDKKAGPEPEANKPEPAAKPESDTKKPEPDTKKPAPDTKKPEPAGGETEPKTPEKPQPSAAEAKPAETAPPAEKIAEPPKTGPSEAAKKAIRRELAIEKIHELFERLKDPLDKYREAIDERPPLPDFKKTAEENGLTFHPTDLIAQWDAAKIDIGSSRQVRIQITAEGELQLVLGPLVLQSAYQSLSKFRPETAIYLKGEEKDRKDELFLYWKTDDAKELVPKFNDVRAEVLRKWKLIRAREPAREAAEALAAEARKAGKPLAEVFAGRKKFEVIKPPPFTWMTSGNVARNYADPKISDVKGGVKFAGGEFMRTVFRLKPGEVGVAMNEPQNIVYMIRLTDFSPSFQVLWDQFVVDDYSTYSAVAGGDQEDMVLAWIKEIKTSAEFEWTPEHKKRQTESPGPESGL